jgi:UDP-N-acetylmuramyl tripeptide synthase
LKEEYYTYDHIRDIEDIGYAKLVVAEQVYEDGWAILNAEIKQIVEMQKRIYSKLAYFCKNAKNVAFSKHIANNGTGILLNDNQIIIYDKGLEMVVAATPEIGLLQSSNEDFYLDAVLASVVALYLSEIPIEEIRKTLVSFKTICSQGS